MICIFGKGAVSLSKIRREREDQPNAIFLRDEMGGMEENLVLSTAFLFIDLIDGMSRINLGIRRHVETCGCLFKIHISSE